MSAIFLPAWRGVWVYHGQSKWSTPASITFVVVYVRNHRSNQRRKKKAIFFRLNQPRSLAEERGGGGEEGEFFDFFSLRPLVVTTNICRKSVCVRVVDPQKSEKFPKFFFFLRRIFVALLTTLHVKNDFFVYVSFLLFFFSFFWERNKTFYFSNLVRSKYFFLVKSNESTLKNTPTLSWVTKLFDFLQILWNSVIT